MRGFDEVIKEGFERHLRAIDSGGSLRAERKREVVGAIRRRRLARGVLAGGASALAVGGLAVGASAILPIHWAPAEGPSPSAVSYSWCDLSTYPAVNPDAIPEEFPYLGRLYEDYEKGKFVFVEPDGTHTIVKPDADGVYTIKIGPSGKTIFEYPTDTYRPEAWTHMIADYWDDGDARKVPHFEDSQDPLLLYEWTTVVPDDVPEGIDMENLVDVHLHAMYLGSSGLGEYSVPPGAIVQSVVKLADGHEEMVEVPFGGSGLFPDGFPDLVSYSTRVTNLPSGGVFEITSIFDPSKTWEAACLRPEPIESLLPPPSESPSPAVNPLPSPSVTPSDSSRVSPSLWPSVTPSPSSGVSPPSSSLESSPSPTSEG